MIRCVHCGEENEPVFTYCLSCGKPLEQSLSSFKPRAAAAQGVVFKLVALRADGTPGNEFILKQGPNTVGARGPEVVIENDPRVADEHAILEIGADVSFLRDLGSKYGTFLRVKGERVLIDGDQLRIGHALFQVELKRPRVQPVADGSAWLGSLGVMPDSYGRLIRLGPEGTVIAAHMLSKPEVILGRTAGDILLSEDPFVSSRHAAFIRSGETCTIKDLGSTNGCYFRIRGRVAIQDGDQVLIGQHLFYFRREEHS